MLSSSSSIFLIVLVAYAANAFNDDDTKNPKTHLGMEFYEQNIFVHKIPSLDELSPLPKMPLLFT